MKKLRMSINIGMTVVLISLMSYSLIGEFTHEILGTAMVVLFTVHHMLNWRWFGALTKGRYRVFRIFQTILVFLLMASVLASAVSGIILSKYLYTFLPIRKGASVARSVHMVSAYWNDILMSLHLGLHWNGMLRAVHRNNGDHAGIKRWVLLMIGIAVAAYGGYAFMKRQIGAYLFLRTRFLFLDPTEPLLVFFLDYAAVMGLFVFCGHYLAKMLKQLDK